jgi:hypothetical protein
VIHLPDALRGGRWTRLDGPAVELEADAVPWDAAARDVLVLVRR